MVDFGDILKTIGDFGFFQKLITLGLAFPNFLLPTFFSSFLFLQSDPERHCNTDWILNAAPNLTKDEQLNLTVPREDDGSFSRCQMFVPVEWSISTIRERGLSNTTECMNGWVYFNLMYETTIVTDFDLVCKKSNLTALAQTVFMLGILFGSFIFSPLADLYGRRRTTQIPAVLLLISAVVTGLSPNYEAYVVCQFVAGAVLGAYRINCIVLATEWIGVSKRSVASCLAQLFAGIGQCAMAGLVYFCRDWRKTQYILAGAQAVVILYIWWIPESARWLMGSGRTEEAKKLIKKVAAINKKEIPETLLNEVNKEQKVQSGGIAALLTSKVLLKYIFIISFAWFSLNLGYFCLMLNVGKFGLSIFLVQFLFGISEAPAHLLCIWVLEILGRKKSMLATLLAGGLVCLLTLAFPQDKAVIITILATTGKFFLIWAGSVVMVYIQELFPTSVRQTAVGLGSIASRIAGLLSPMLNLLAIYHPAIPIVVFSSLSVVSGALIILLPETARKELPESTFDAKTSGIIISKDENDNGRILNGNIKSTKL